MVAWDIALETRTMSSHLKYRSTITKNVLPIQCPNESKCNLTQVLFLCSHGSDRAVRGLYCFWQKSELNHLSCILVYFKILDLKALDIATRFCHIKLF